MRITIIVSSSLIYFSCGDRLYPFVISFTRFLDNLKDYAVRALVNAIDHIGTVSYKFSDIVEQQATEISAIDLKVACINQVMNSHFITPHCKFIQH